MATMSEFCAMTTSKNCLFRKEEIASVGEDVGEIRNFKQSSLECKTVQLLRKPVWQFLKN